MLLSVITRTFKRPKMLEANRKSLKMQSFQDYEEIVIRDDVGIGCAEANYRLCLVEPKGNYVWVFDDDNVLEDDTFFEELKKLTDELHPDVVFVKGYVVGNILPDRWPIEVGHIDTMNFVVSNVIWQKYKNHWNKEYAADWTFIEAIMKDDPKVAWLGMVACKTIRGSRGAKEEWDFELPADVLSRDPNRAKLQSVRDTIKVGDIIRSNIEAAGLNFICHRGQEIVITRENFDHCEGLLRSGRAEFVSAGIEREEIKQTLNKRILIFCPIGAKLEPETKEAIFTQEGIGSCDIMFTRDNQYAIAGQNAMLNVQHNYEKMRKIVFECGYDKVWICEADMIPPKDALKKLLEIDAPIVTGLYALRHGAPATNLLRIEKDVHGFNWNDIMANWGKTMDVGGGCMGCVVIDRSVLEKFSFILDKPVAPDVPLMQWCIQNKIHQVARLDVVCGHITSLGEILWPDKERQVIKTIKRVAA